MPRIRTIKPEFWDDEKIANLIFPARLLFIGLWNFSDDYGIVRANTAWIKSRLFPYDDNLRLSEVQKWLDALVNARMLIPFIFENESYYKIRSFNSHQLIDKKGRRTVPEEIEKQLVGDDLKIFSESSANSRRIVGEGSALERKGKERSKAKDSKVQTTEDEIDNKDKDKGASPAFLEVTDEEKKEMGTLCENIKIKSNGFNPFVFVQKAVQFDVPASVTIKVLRSILKNQGHIRNYWAYAVAVLKREDEESFVAERIAAHMQLKNEDIGMYFKHMAHGP